MIIKVKKVTNMNNKNNYYLEIKVRSWINNKRKIIIIIIIIIILVKERTEQERKMGSLKGRMIAGVETMVTSQPHNLYNLD